MKPVCKVHAISLVDTGEELRPIQTVVVDLDLERIQERLKERDCLTVALEIGSTILRRREQQNEELEMLGEMLGREMLGVDTL